MARAKARTKASARTKRKPAAKAGRAKARTAKRVAKPAKRSAARAAKRPVTPSARRTRTATAPSTAMRALAQQIIDLTLANDDEGTFALYADDVESSEASGPPTVGVDALRGKFAGWREMVSDSSFEPRRVVVDGNVIVIEWLGRVTLRASGRQAELHEVAVHEIRDGKIVREAFFYNPAALAPEPAVI